MNPPNKEDYKQSFLDAIKPQKLSEAKSNYLFGYLKCIWIRKGKTFCKEGFVCNRVGYIIEGNFYAHGSNAKGEKKTTDFFHSPVDRVLTNFLSFNTGSLSTDTIEAYPTVFYLSLPKKPRYQS